MKKLILILLCLPLLFSCGDKIKKKDNSIKNSTKEESINSNKQKKDDITEQFKSDLKQLSKATNNKDWNTVLDMTYPKLLDYVTKEELIKEFESIFLLFKDFQSKPSEDIVISPIINFEGFQFVRIFYDQEALFTFYNNDDLDDALGNFKNGFGNNNVKVFSEKQSISVNIESSIVAVLEENSSKWKYIEWKEDLFDNIDIIPITVLEKLK